MTEFFSQISDGIRIALDFLIGIIDGFLQIFSFIPVVFEFITALAGFLPGYVWPFLLAIVTISVVYLIIGR